MRVKRRLLPLLLVTAASFALLWACSDVGGPSSRPAIPTITARQIGPTYCSEWSCSYDQCHLMPGYDPMVGSCCLLHTLDIGQAQPAPQCSRPPESGGSCPGSYALDGGISYNSVLDDQWFCPVSLSCCAGGVPSVIWYTCGAALSCSNPHPGQYPPIPAPGY